MSILLSLSLDIKLYDGHKVEQQSKIKEKTSKVKKFSLFLTDTLYKF